MGNGRNLIEKCQNHRFSTIKRPKSTQNAKNPSKWPKRPQNGQKSPQKGSKMTQHRSKSTHSFLKLGRPAVRIQTIRSCIEKKNHQKMAEKWQKKHQKTAKKQQKTAEKRQKSSKMVEKNSGKWRKNKWRHEIFVSALSRKIN
jgi:hypothetical protein